MSATKHIKFEGPANYRITVQGKLTQSWKDQLGILSCEEKKDNEHYTITTFTCHIQDQSTLSGILTRLYDVHLPILSVQCLYNVKSDNISQEN